MDDTLLKYDSVEISFGGNPVVHDISFSLRPGEILGLVGESGSGKSTLIKAAMGLLGDNGLVTRGDITYKGKNLVDMPERELKSIRGAQIGMIFAFGLRIKMFFLHCSKSKSKYGITSILLISTTSQIENISGYFKGLSCPSGTDKIIAFFTAPVSNSAGHTRFPTFSKITSSTSSVPSPFSPCLVISASR